MGHFVGQCLETHHMETTGMANVAQSAALVLRSCVTGLSLSSFEQLLR